MAPSRTLAIPFLSAFVFLLLLAPTAVAHVTYTTDDEAYFITVGLQGEPVYTFQTTNIDLIVHENVNGERGDEVAGVHETLSAVLIGPGGEELPGVLETQRGSEGRYGFEDAFALSQPGVYTLRLQGVIGESPVDGVYDLPHAIESQSDIMFPETGLGDLRELNARLNALEGEVASLEAQLEAVEAQGGAGSTEAPAPGFLLVAVLGIGIALLARRRSGH